MAYSLTSQTMVFFPTQCQRKTTVWLARLWLSFCSKYVSYIGAFLVLTIKNKNSRWHQNFNKVLPFCYS